MKKIKMSLANIEGKLSRVEMKKIMAGSGDGCLVGKSCWNAYRAANGVCYPFGLECLCNAMGSATYSYDCIIYA
ncbi:MAG: hypothetical protein QM763_08525 [Agriterribacter sp.]